MMDINSKKFAYFDANREWERNIDLTSPCTKWTDVSGFNRKNRLPDDICFIIFFFSRNIIHEYNLVDSVRKK